VGALLERLYTARIMRVVSEPLLADTNRSAERAATLLYGAEPLEAWSMSLTAGADPTYLERPMKASWELPCQTASPMKGAGVFGITPPQR